MLEVAIRHDHRVAARVIETRRDHGPEAADQFLLGWRRMDGGYLLTVACSTITA